MSSTRSADCWEKLNLVLMAVTMGTINENELNGIRFLVLHAFLAMIHNVGLFCGHVADLFSAQAKGALVLDILKLIKTRAPEQFRTRDDDGSLPLHVVSQSEGHVEKASVLIECLIEEYPESVTLPDGQERLPLHIALKHGIPCYKTLMDEHPAALETPFPATGLYPFQLAATETTAVDISFTLLRLAPHAMNNLVNGTTAKKPWIHGEPFKKIQRNKLQITQRKMNMT